MTTWTPEGSVSTNWSGEAPPVFTFCDLLEMFPGQSFCDLLVVYSAPFTFCDLLSNLFTGWSSEPAVTTTWTPES